MRQKNKQITYSETDIIEALKEINLILISLRKMGTFYSEELNEDENRYQPQYEMETTRFIDECRVTHRLAFVRQILSEKFVNSLGTDNMSDLERTMETLKYWEKPGDMI